jgi:hypothetical protein
MLNIILKNLNKKDMAIIILVALVSLGAVVADIILVVKLIEQWRALVAASVLTGAALGGIYYIYQYLKKAAAAAA